VTCQRAVSHQGEALPGEVVDHHQHSEAPAIAQHIGGEVETPALVRALAGTVNGARVPSARLRPPRFLTVSRSSRYNRNRRLWLTTKPSRGSGMVAYTAPSMTRIG